MSTRRPRRLVLLLAAFVVLSSGCGEGRKFNKDAEYTPESLAQELVFRYKALSPSGKTSKRARRPEKKAVGTKADELSTTKSQTKAATKKELAKTIDDVLDEIEVKTGLVKGMSRSDVIGKMIEAVSKDTSLGETDRQALAGKLKEFGSG